MPHYHPPHLYLDDTWYIITAATHRRQPLLASNQAQQRLRDSLQALAQQYDISLRAWVILHDHYHALLKPHVGRDLPRFIRHLHGRTARQLNLDNASLGRQIWQNYWDTCIRTEHDLWTRFNYIHLNPVKHGYVLQAADWSFSSYRYFLRTKGAEWLGDCLTRYPVADVLEGDAFDLDFPLAKNVASAQARALSTQPG